MKGHPSYLEHGVEWRPDGDEAGSLLSSEAQPSHSLTICRQRSAPDVRLLVTFVHFTKDFESHFSPSKKKKIPFPTKKKKKKSKKEGGVRRERQCMRKF